MMHVIVTLRKQQDKARKLDTITRLRQVERLSACVHAQAGSGQVAANLKEFRNGG